MTAVLRDDAVAIPPEPRPAAKQAPQRLQRSAIGAGGDPLADAATRLLAIPLRQVYAVLWRMGLIEVRA